MKLFAKLLVLLLIAAMAGPFVIKGPDGQPLMSWSDVTQKFRNPFGSVGSTGSGKAVEVHRWQDETGQWHYSDEAPPQDSEIITVDPNANVIQSTPVPVKAPVDPPSPSTTPVPDTDKPPSLLNPIDETRQVRDELERRNNELRQRLDDT